MSCPSQQYKMDRANKRKAKQNGWHTGDFEDDDEVDDAMVDEVGVQARAPIAYTLQTCDSHLNPDTHALGIRLTSSPP